MAYSLWLIQGTLEQGITHIQVFPRSRGVVSHLVTGASLRAGNRQCWASLPQQAQPVPITSAGQEEIVYDA